MNQVTRSVEGLRAKVTGCGRQTHDAEVVAMSQRRRFTATYKRRVLAEADACTEPGQVGALWRREGLYSSPLTTWRRPREQGVLEALTPQKRGRKVRGLDPLAQRVVDLERENAHLSHQLKQAETIITVQKKVSEILGIALEANASGVGP